MEPILLVSKVRLFYGFVLSSMLCGLGYCLEVQELGSLNWEKVSDYIPGTTYTVKGLDEGKQYTFRVKAENLVGVGEPLTGMPVITKDPFSKRLLAVV